MQTVLRIGSTRFFFFSNEGSEPPHIHVEHAGALARFWLEPVSLASSSRFSDSVGANSVGSRGRWPTTDNDSWTHGMTTSEPVADPCAVGVSVSDDELSVDLAEGRRLSVPLAWFPRLLHASPQQRGNWRILGDGQGIHWPDVDEDLSVAGLLRGAAAPGASRKAV